jgi:hypothetical protein
MSIATDNLLRDKAQPSIRLGQLQAAVRDVAKRLEEARWKDPVAETAVRLLEEAVRASE